MVNFAAQKEKEAKVLADLKGLVEKVGFVRTTFPTPFSCTCLFAGLSLLQTDQLQAACFVCQ